ncbi:flagellin [Bacillus sp. FJAT-22090]|uniref:flagellin N-terminal helical domain-containing protein n=1 Tax=Bacillus sp. FJAT-22090 TaxID=1581038 RepID=UPI0011A3271B|nr:flagellin [Bacillus sp. FJAT-22090]
MLVNGNGLSKLLNNQKRKTETSLQKTLGKLASGKKINTADDNASGLAISQKLLAIKRGSHQAIRNVQDASSLLNTADSAMQEMTDVVHRIRELTVQAMNGTSTQVGSSVDALTPADTLVIQNEIDQLKKNLNEIVQNTEFNSIKLLTNKTPGEFIYENRTASKTIQLLSSSQNHMVDRDQNKVGYNKIEPVVVTNSNNITSQPTTNIVTKMPESYIASTVVDHIPRWSTDGESIVFSSSRDGGQYIVPSDGGSNPVENTAAALGQQTSSSNGLLRLTNLGSTLALDKYSNGSWTRVQSITDYNVNDGSGGYSFSPKVDGNGNTAFVYSDSQGNIKKIEVNQNSLTVTSGASNVIPTSDTLNLPPANNTITLPDSPEIYKMDSAGASLRIQKVNDSGTRELTYWNGAGAAPVGGYYMVSGTSITFYGEAIIGNESIDNAKDYYRFSYIADSLQDSIYTTSIPTSADVYNMHGEDGPRSLKISVGGTVVTKFQLLSARPSDVEGTNGVFVDTVNGKIEFYGSLRPSASESVQIEYFTDVDGRNGIQTYTINSNIDTYNLKDTDLSSNRALRVYIGGREITYDETKTNGYTYENGRINLYGDARPDVASNPTIKIDYVYDSTSTSKEVYGIPLNSYSEIYNLESNVSPKSIRVYRNDGEEISYSDTNGYQYNSATNTIELYGTARPNIGDKYSIKMIVPTGDAVKQDNKIEIPLTHAPETYGIPNPMTFKVIVDGTEVNYDESKTNGYFYNSGTQKIELYGDARPDAGQTSGPEVEIYYVFESPSTRVGNDSYDFRLSNTTIDYGVKDQSEPRAIRVYQKGLEVPYDADNGFTYDNDTKLLSLHGIYRPNKDNDTGDYQIYSITSDDLQQSVPQGSYIYKVEMNGQVIPKANNQTEDGYLYNGQQVKLIGNARPDITNTTSEIGLSIQYFESLDISLNANMPKGYLQHYCDHELGEALMESEIDPNSFVVKLDGNALTTNQYYFQDNKIFLNHDSLMLSTGSHTLDVDYRARQGIGYEGNDFTFQVGANAGQSLKVEIASFDNMLRDTNVVCVRNYEDAAKGLKIIDDALSFILGELGSVGATQNRLDHIASNLSVLEENTTTSMSRIQDTDMAKQAMILVKEQLLSQVQQTLTSQVQQSSAQVLELLK